MQKKKKEKETNLNLKFYFYFALIYKNIILHEYPCNLVISN